MRSDSANTECQPFELNSSVYNSIRDSNSQTLLQGLPLIRDRKGQGTKRGLEIASLSVPGQLLRLTIAVPLY